jgi:hypothetical protein
LSADDGDGHSGWGARLGEIGVDVGLQQVRQ